MSQVLQDDAPAQATTTPTTAEYEDQGEAFSRAIAREYQQVLALVEVAEREQDRRTALETSKLVAFIGFIGLLLLSTITMSVAPFNWSSPITGGVAGAVAGALALTWFKLTSRQRKHQKAAAEVAETIREVVSASNWQAKLDPLDWAHLRTRIANLELIDLSSLK